MGPRLQSSYYITKETYLKVSVCPRQGALYMESLMSFEVGRGRVGRGAPQASRLIGQVCRSRDYCLGDDFKDVLMI